MDGAASMKAAAAAAAAAVAEGPSGDAVDLDSSVPAASALPGPGEDVYVVLLVKASLKLLGKDLPPQIRHYGFEMMQGPPINFLDGRGREHDQQGKYKVTPDYQEEAELLRWEHNLLSEAFLSVTTCPGYNGNNILLHSHVVTLSALIKFSTTDHDAKQIVCLLSARIECKEELLMSLLKPLNKIWTQPEWNEEYMRYTYRLTGLLCNDQFMETICLLVKSFEEEIKGRKIEHSTGTQEKCRPTSTTNYPYSSTFPQLMLALLLRILHFIHMAWMDRSECYDLPEIIWRARLISTNEISSFLKENNTLPANDGVDVRRMNAIGTWLREIRETGYNIIGLCASVERSMFGLDCSLFIDTLAMDISFMDFDHVGKLIQLTFIPLLTSLCHSAFVNLAVSGINLFFSKQSSVQSNTGEQEDRKMCMDGFSDWFEKELEDLHRRASLPAPIFFPKYLVWNWEFNEECDRYFPTYLEMLHEVDTMNDCLAPVRTTFAIGRTRGPTVSAPEVVGEGWSGTGR
ncbi:uncharacterized protein LOC125547126 [Triticum urartu]|uniref:uncharacterized protein LOC125547126 n=1 Tax=Triticum urartu TaxID=4572 RepID=UPI002042F521|nr:uncharacterized protein LOC125547126 [Triticum urartu]